MDSDLNMQGQGEEELMLDLESKSHNCPLKWQMSKLYEIKYAKHEKPCVKTHRELSNTKICTYILGHSYLKTADC